MKDQSDDPSHHERTLLPQSYISLLTEIVYAPLMGGVTGNLQYCSTGTVAVFMEKEGRKEVFELTMCSSHFIYGYLESDTWLTAIQI